MVWIEESEQRKRQAQENTNSRTSDWVLPTVPFNLSMSPQKDFESVSLFPYEHQKYKGHDRSVKRRDKRTQEWQH